jgi:hypothetical protein
VEFKHHRRTNFKTRNEFTEQAATMVEGGKQEDECESLKNVVNGINVKSLTLMKRKMFFFTPIVFT